MSQYNFKAFECTIFYAEPTNPFQLVINYTNFTVVIISWNMYFSSMPLSAKSTYFVFHGTRNGRIQTKHHFLYSMLVHIMTKRLSTATRLPLGLVLWVSWMRIVYSGFMPIIRNSCVQVVPSISWMAKQDIAVDRFYW